ncbi:MAG TPA: hypothetical protein DCE42_14765 [Myxococcales bacterium]|nr:hypothetical protein [Myxococcales bacterium]
MSKVRTASTLSRISRLVAYSMLPFVLGLPMLVTGCNDYPFQRLVAQTYTEVTDTQPQTASKQVDILFVVDNSGSMQEEQTKLKTNFEAFINELLDQEVTDFQIGVITTDMDSAKEAGRLQGTTKIINGAQLTKKQVIDAFVANTSVGIAGSPYEKGLDALKAALSPSLLAADNKGFLRDGALLAIIIVGDEDDCSHGGKISERDFLSDVCYSPPSVIMKETDGTPRQRNGVVVKGMRDKLIPVKDYINFLKGLKDSKGRQRDVIVSGLIGSPKVLVDDPANPGQKRLKDPPGGCTADNQCSVGSEPHFCGYVNTAGARQCGGCESADAKAEIPGFRFYELIQGFTPGDAADQLWFPICGGDNEFKAALLRFAGAILNRINFVVLSKTPSVSASGVPYIQVTIIQENGTKIPANAAQPTGSNCTKDADCGQKFVCGADSKCYGDGWVYFPPIQGNPQARIKLSGTAKDNASAGSTIDVSYAAGP